jgi:hypothetical protein
MQTFFHFAAGANVYADVWCYSEQAESTALTTEQYEHLIAMAEDQMRTELQDKKLVTPVWDEAEHNGVARDEEARRELIDCVKACKIYGYNFCVNILGCPGRRLLFETDHKEGDSRSLAALKAELSAALPEAAHNALLAFASDESLCDAPCSDALLTSACEATVQIV